MSKILYKSSTTTTSEELLYVATNENNKNKMVEALARPFILEMLSKETLFGEPFSEIRPTLTRYMCVEPSKVSHRIKNFKWDGLNLIGEVVTVDTMSGRMLKDILDSELGSLRFTPRMLGKYQDNYIDLLETIQVVTFDWKFHNIAELRNVMERNANES